MFVAISTETTQTFNVQPDSEGPVFDAAPGTIADISCQDGLPVQETLTATDVCGTTTVTPSVDTFTEDQCGGYAITYRWTATDVVWKYHANYAKLQCLTRYGDANV